MKNRLRINSEPKEIVNQRKRIFRLDESHYEHPEFTN